MFSPCSDLPYIPVSTANYFPTLLYTLIPRFIKGSLRDVMQFLEVTGIERTNVS
jgi:hypothetical protein